MFACTSSIAFLLQSLFVSAELVSIKYPYGNLIHNGVSESSLVDNSRSNNYLRPLYDESFKNIFDGQSISFEDSDYSDSSSKKLQYPGSYEVNNIIVPSIKMHSLDNIDLALNWERYSTWFEQHTTLRFTYSHDFHHFKSQKYTSYPVTTDIFHNRESEVDVRTEPPFIAISGVVSGVISQLVKVSLSPSTEGYSTPIGALYNSGHKQASKTSPTTLSTSSEFNPVFVAQNLLKLILSKQSTVSTSSTSNMKSIDSRTDQSPVYAPPSTTSIEDHSAVDDNNVSDIWNQESPYLSGMTDNNDYNEINPLIDYNIQHKDYDNDETIKSGFFGNEESKLAHANQPSPDEKLWRRNFQLKGHPVYAPKLSLITKTSEALFTDTTVYAKLYPEISSKENDDREVLMEYVRSLYPLAYLKPSSTVKNFNSMATKLSQASLIQGHASKKYKKKPINSFIGSNKLGDISDIKMIQQFQSIDTSHTADTLVASRSIVLLASQTIATPVMNGGKQSDFSVLNTKSDLLHDVATASAIQRKSSSYQSVARFTSYGFDSNDQNTNSEKVNPSTISALQIVSQVISATGFDSYKPITTSVSQNSKLLNTLINNGMQKLQNSHPSEYINILNGSPTNSVNPSEVSAVFAKTSDSILPEIPINSTIQSDQAKCRRMDSQILKTSNIDITLDWVTFGSLSTNATCQQTSSNIQSSGIYPCSMFTFFIAESLSFLMNLTQSDVSDAINSSNDINPMQQPTLRKYTLNIASAFQNVSEVIYNLDGPFSAEFTTNDGVNQILFQIAHFNATNGYLLMIPQFVSGESLDSIETSIHSAFKISFELTSSQLSSSYQDGDNVVQNSVAMVMAQSWAATSSIVQDMTDYIASIETHNGETLLKLRIIPQQFMKGQPFDQNFECVDVCR